MPFPVDNTADAGLLPGGSASPQPYGPVVGFKTEGVLPPGALYIGPDDLLLVLAWNPILTPAQFGFSARILRPDGSIEFMVESVSITGTHTILPFTKRFQPGEGFLLSLAIDSSPNQRGQLFIKALLFRDGTFGGFGPGSLLCQGYVTFSDAIGYPPGNVESSVSGRGAIRGIVIPNPAAGANASLSVPLSVRWRIQSVFIIFTTSAVVSNREVFMTVVDPAGLLMVRVLRAVVQIAGTQTSYNWAPGNTLQNDQFIQSMGLPHDLYVRGGSTINVFFITGDPADQFTAGVVGVEEWVDIL